MSAFFFKIGTTLLIVTVLAGVLVGMSSEKAKDSWGFMLLGALGLLFLLSMSVAGIGFVWGAR